MKRNIRHIHNLTRAGQKYIKKYIKNNFQHSKIKPKHIRNKQPLNNPNENDYIENRTKLHMESIINQRSIKNKIDTKSNNVINWIRRSS